MANGGSQGPAGNHVNGRFNKCEDTDSGTGSASSEAHVIRHIDRNILSCQICLQRYKEPKVRWKENQSKVRKLNFYLDISGPALSSYILPGLPGSLFATRKFDNNLSSLRTAVHFASERGKKLDVFISCEMQVLLCRKSVSGYLWVQQNTCLECVLLLCKKDLINLKPGLH